MRNTWFPRKKCSFFFYVCPLSFLPIPSIPFTYPLEYTHLSLIFTDTFPELGDNTAS